MSKVSSRPSGGLKGIIQRTGKLFYAGGIFVRDSGTTLFRYGYEYGGRVAFGLATTSMIVLMPLLFEITREVQVRFTSIKRLGCSRYVSLKDLVTRIVCSLTSDVRDRTCGSERV
jgi:hypothetical protein